MNARITTVASYLPAKRQTSADIERLVAEESPDLSLTSGIFEILTGIQSRPIAAPDEYPSVLAYKAGQRALDQAGLAASDIDLLLFASASQDILEPATGNIVQTLLGVTCPIIDVKNACNSFINGVEIARSFILAGHYRRVLVVTGETPSGLSQFAFNTKQELAGGLAGLTLGDAGAAAIVEASESGVGIYYSQFTTVGKHWERATLPGGGARHPRGDEFMRFHSDGGQLKDAFVELNRSVVDNALGAAGKTWADFAQVYIHQVSYPFLLEAIETIGVPADKVYVTVKDYGNLVSASLPTAIALSREEGLVGPGDQIFVLGLASGISVGILMLEL